MTLPSPLMQVFCRHAGAFGACAAGVFSPAGSSTATSGVISHAGESIPVEDTTLFDLASLTKPVCAFTAHHLVEKGLLSLDEPVATMHKELSDATLAQLMNHSSGLVAYRPFFETADTPEALYRELVDTPLIASPGNRFEYSDLGYILLGRFLSDQLAEPWPNAFMRATGHPLGLDFHFHRAPSALPLVPNREPGLVVDGLVHDENARILGPVTGHAGLFGNCRSLLVWLSELCRALCEPRPHMPFPETIRRMWTPLHPEDPFTCGWDRPSGSGFTTAGKNVDRRQTVGHLGFTGGAFWIHPAKSTGGVLLTNRITLGRHEGMDRLRTFRSDFFKALWENCLSSDSTP